MLYPVYHIPTLYAKECGLPSQTGNRIPHPSGGYLCYRVRIGLGYLSSAGRVHRRMTYDTRRGFLLRR